MKIALVIDFLMQRGGAEWLLEVIHSLYPQADIFTLLYDPDETREYFKDKNIIVHPFLKRLPLIKKHWRKYLPIFPYAIKQFDFRGYDIVLSISFLVAKGINVPPNTQHICYCLTPMRQAWDKSQMEYKFIAQYFWNYLRQWDISAASKPNSYLAISNAVAERIKERYSRDAKVIYPPVDTDFFIKQNWNPEFIRGQSNDYFLVVSRLVPYKKVGLVISAFDKLGYRLKIVGTGREERKLKKISINNNIEFLGEISNDKLRDLYYNCNAVICAQEEDFGIVAAEAQVCGKPVIAFNKGGISEIVKHRETGILFEEQSVESIIEAVRQYQQTTFDYQRTKETAIARFNIKQFSTQLKVHLFP